MNKGRVRISKELYENSYDLVKGIFQHIRPLNIEHRYWDHGDYVIWADSEEFEKLQEGEEIPFYDCQMTSNGHFTFDRI